MNKLQTPFSLTKSGTNEMKMKMKDKMHDSILACSVIRKYSFLLGSHMQTGLNGFV